jgi:hypothetical protein
MKGADDIAAQIATSGWARLGPDPGIFAWARAALPLARQAVDTAAEEWRCGGTWLAGVDALANGPGGEVGGTALPSSLLDLLPGPTTDWHRAQLSTLRPGYPQPWDGETEAAFGYRRNRDAAHVDGLLPIGPDRRRMLREPHAFILGLPLTGADPEASPLVVWEGSHDMVRSAFAEALRPHPPERWPDIDLTEVYHAVRRRIFAGCLRVPLPIRPGAALLLHRMVLHGMAPWAEGAVAAPEGRAIAYLRPELDRPEDWLNLP